MASEENPVATEEMDIDSTIQTKEVDENNKTDENTEKKSDENAEKSDKNTEKSDENTEKSDENTEKPGESRNAEDDAKNDKEISKDNAKKNGDGSAGNDTPRSMRSVDSKLRDQMMAEFERVRKEMMSSASLIKRPPLKPYTPDIFNDLGPYYNTYLIDYAMKDQDLIQKPWGSYGQRETAVNIVAPEISLKMDTFPLPPVSSNVPGQLFKMKAWSKNLSGKDQDLGSTRLPPVPSLGVKKLHNPEYQYFRMTYDEVPKFREDVRKMYASISQKRADADYERVQKDWKRMNLDELKDLPERSRSHYGRAVTTYLGTSKGSFKAASRLSRSLNGSEAL